MSGCATAKFNRVKDLLTVDEIIAAYKMAMTSMSTLNLDAAKLMRKYDAHGCTDVTGFGILGHANNLAQEQEDAVDLVIHTLPIIRSMAKVERHLNNQWKLFFGRSAETSGGLLIMMTPENAAAYVEEYKQVTGHDAWIVGEVTEGERRGIVKEDPTLIEVMEW